MTLTPNIGIFIPGDGEDDWGQSFDAGLYNIDQHDHSGGPNKGVPLTGAAIAVGSITPDKFASSVYGTGVQANSSNKAIELSGVVLSFYNVGGAAAGIPAVITAGSTVAMRTITGTAGQIDVTSGNGVADNPTISLPLSQQLSPATGNVTISPVLGNVYISPQTAGQFIEFDAGATYLSSFYKPANDNGARSYMLSSDSTERVGFNTVESRVNMNSGDTITFIGNMFLNQMWQLFATSQGGTYYCSYIWYGGNGSGYQLVSVTTSPAGTGCSFSYNSGTQNLEFTNSSGGNRDFRLVGVRIY